MRLKYKQRRAQEYYASRRTTFRSASFKTYYTKSSSSGRIMRLVPVFKGTLRSNDATAMRTSLKNEFAIFQSLSQLFLPTYFVNVGEPSWS